MLHPLMPREKREMDLRKGRRDDNSFAVETFTEVCMVRGQLTGWAHASPRRVAKKVRRFCLLMKFPSRSSGTVRKHGEMKRERDSLVIRWW